MGMEDHAYEAKGGSHSRLVPCQGYCNSKDVDGNTQISDVWSVHVQPTSFMTALPTGAASYARDAPSAMDVYHFTEHQFNNRVNIRTISADSPQLLYHIRRGTANSCSTPI